MIIIFQPSALIYLDHSTYQLSKNSERNGGSQEELGWHLFSCLVEHRRNWVFQSQKTLHYQILVSLGWRPWIEAVEPALAQLNHLSSLMTSQISFSQKCAKNVKKQPTHIIVLIFFNHFPQRYRLRRPTVSLPRLLQAKVYKCFTTSEERSPTSQPAVSSSPLSNTQHLPGKPTTHI